MLECLGQAVGEGRGGVVLVGVLDLVVEVEGLMAAVAIATVSSKTNASACEVTESHKHQYKCGVIACGQPGNATNKERNLGLTRGAQAAGNNRRQFSQVGWKKSRSSWQPAILIPASSQSIHLQYDSLTRSPSRV